MKDGQQCAPSIRICIQLQFNFRSVSDFINCPVARAHDGAILDRRRREIIMETGLEQKASSTVSVSAELDRPTRARNWVIFFAVTLAIITYIDRVCISQAAPAMQRDLGLSKVQMGWVFSAFAWAYALFEIPGGWLGDRWGRAGC